MEQCIARLDVAMFNAILRESDDDIPTDPMSDPITDPKVLPIPSGKFSFGAGVQLKNAIGSWSRCLTDLFGMDMDDYPEVESGCAENGITETLKPFYLLNALSDLLMIPKDVLMETSTRKEAYGQIASGLYGTISNLIALILVVLLFVGFFNSTNKIHKQANIFPIQLQELLLPRRREWLNPALRCCWFLLA